MTARESAAQPEKSEARDRTALIAAYREGLGLAAVVVTDGPEGICIAVGEPRGDPSAVPGHARWWCRRRTDAERVATGGTALLQRRHTKDGATAAATAILDAMEAVAAAAKRLGVALCCDDDVALEAGRIIARIDREIEVLRRAGGLNSINRAYKSYRIETSGRGDKVLPYAQWFNKYRQNLLRELAAALRYR